MWRLSEPFPIATGEDAVMWKARYLAACDLLEREFGIECDRSCADWTRLFRLPHATRDGAAPEELETIGDTHKIGVIALPEVIITPRALSVLRPSDAPASPPKVIVKDVDPFAPPRAYLLRQLLQARGDILGDRPDGSAIIRCPNAAAHTTGRDGDGSTILFPPKESGYGWIDCKHDHCRKITTEQWIAMLRGDEARDPSVRTAKITGAWIDEREDYGTRVVLRLEATDEGEELPYLRIYEKHRKRWRALWDACDVDPPFEGDEADLRDACSAIVGRTIRVELDGDRVRRILAA